MITKLLPISPVDSKWSTKMASGDVLSNSHLDGQTGKCTHLRNGNKPVFFNEHINCRTLIFIVIQGKISELLVTPLPKEQCLKSKLV